MPHITIGSSIECLGAEIHSRKFVPKIVVNIPNVGRCYKYSGDRNSDAVITKELHPKVPKYSTNSALSLSESIAGEGIFILVNSVKQLLIKVSPYTHRHKAQYCSTNVFTYAEITKPFPNIGEIINSKLLQNPNSGLLDI
ncbi:hypothetical protein [Chitinophaga agri]|uniref:Uncharacterized protein n=1 Tax=Chitinophaga agri TaxID=2703787 RepID=A0A6B9ZPW1_9BACT|nr:hypothetical protein [Chitinophaga agri]QHS63255.1 hypothetical protein GWR21_27820 [Chitinophaga agri]